MDCGPACLQMILKHYGRYYPLSWLRSISFLSREGVSLKGIGKAAERVGLRTMAVKVPFGSRSDQPCLLNAPFPLIVHWNQNHFVVVRRATKKYVWIADPAAGKHKLAVKDFLRNWESDNGKGVALLVEPTPSFYTAEDPPSDKLSTKFVLNYLRPYRRLGWQLSIGLMVSSVLAILFPFLTQAIVDTGIVNQDIGFIYLILIGQLVLFVTQIGVRFIQSWILLHIGTRLNVSLISDFLVKLMRLPLGYFDTKMTGDLLQRIGDHRRIEAFLTQSTLGAILAVFNLLAFSVVLLYYSVDIFAIFLGASLLYFGWIAFFLKLRKEIDYRAFEQYSATQDSLIEIVQAMPEIKLQGSQLKRRWRWAEIQAKLFRVQMSALRIGQWQEAGGSLINQSKNIVITVIAATGVIGGELTLGMMLAIQYIIGQLNGPLEQMIQFVRSGQDAKISLDRLGEIHAVAEEGDAMTSTPRTYVAPPVPPKNGDLRLENVSFKYNALSEEVLSEVDLVIPQGKVTAIVGTSGSGKTTLLKLLLGFYLPTKGKLFVGQHDLSQLDQQAWRDQCGVVMQDGYIFSDTIANNVSESADWPETGQLNNALHVANIDDFVGTLPLGVNTMIGARGNGVSQGQRQRLLIARAVYKDPAFVFLDEATNSLDANNERTIVTRLDEFLHGKTVVVVAHRLSTVSHADKIVVLESGRIVEEDTHHKLIAARGHYYTLIKNQLELGN
jgi:ATP-binding cassette subfamily B protein